MKKIIISIIFISLIVSCKSVNNNIADNTAGSYKEIENKITLKDRAGLYKSKSPYFVLNIDLKNSGYAYVTLKGWMVYNGMIKVGEPNSEDKIFKLHVDNITYIILEFNNNNLDNAKASIFLKDVLQQAMNLDKA
ncbi:hypothetical protein [Brachyspira pilosicoli]|uniref:Lipoprotein n=1 Tax=Brachyspira pilosicoli TaxID=52584 RepID=A0A5C8F4J7_BRAPL|nr:hypothetical protein [Brachyspira pilosicoli]TXJ45227.1 hypothetical protein EPJ72_02870 [Brachyspira pilosicoli]